MATAIQILDDGEGRGGFLLTLMDADERTAALFEDRGLQGGGYTWEGIVTALVRMRAPESLNKLKFGAEADNMYIYCPDRLLLEEVAGLVRKAIAEHDLLLAAIEYAGKALE
jgi:hypothetical protein